MHPTLQVGLWILVSGLAATPAARADALGAVQVLREGGCGGILPAAQPLRREPALDRIAARWATGRELSAAAEGSVYVARSTAGVHVNGADQSLLQLLRRTECRTVMSRELHEVGVYRRGLDTWLVLASDPSASRSVAPRNSLLPPPARSARAFGSAGAAESPQLLATRALALVNQAREHGFRCGKRRFDPAPPLSLSSTLAGVALGHASDMAEHDYFEHQDLAGHSPADRVRATGYQEKLVGENIAYGPESVDEAVRGWLASPGHCTNIMDPRFSEMGIAYVGASGARQGRYWVQVLAEPQRY
ncbi:MAG TPA: CAP domain-containing protein [Steroidobacteraceae bacterium]|nr:CAP domain-containing protein [Steroidobacteraceae bacterium]